MNVEVGVWRVLVLSVSFLVGVERVRCAVVDELAHCWALRDQAGLPWGVLGLVFSWCLKL